MRWSTLGHCTARHSLLLFVGVTIYSLFPMYWMVSPACGPSRHCTSPLLLPGPYAMKSYQTIFSLTDFPTYYVNSIIVALSTTC